MSCLSINTPKDVFAASIILGLFADIKIINLFVVAVKPSLAGSFMTMMYIVVAVSLFYVGFFAQKNYIKHWSRGQMLVLFVAILWYVFSFLFLGPPSVGIPFFGVFVVASFLIPSVVQIDVRTLLLAMLVMPFWGILYIDRVFFDDIIVYGYISMGLSYALLVPVMANLIYLLFFYDKNQTWLKKAFLIFFSACNIYYLIMMMTYGSRGPFLCIFSMILFYFVIKYKEGWGIVIYKQRMFILCVGLVLVSLFFESILVYFSELLKGYDISLNIIDKFLRKGEEGDMTNGREPLVNMAWNGFLNAPLIGHGTAQFERNTGGIYPHNFLLQILYDGGITLFLLILIPLGRAFMEKIKKITKDEFVILFMFFFFSVPGALFSGDLWQAYRIWLFFGAVFSANFIYESKKHDKWVI